MFIVRRPVALSLVVVLAAALIGERPASIGTQIAQAAERQVGVTVVYDPSYVSIRYPGGDLPASRGVCADVVIRAYRAAGIDLQREVHEDMVRAFSRYPRMWGLAAPDPNIDHRRVPNLMKFFERRGKAVSGAFEAGDVVAWRLPGGLYHIGVVSLDAGGGGRPLMIHNIGRGAEKEDVLFAFQVIGHYRWQ